VLNRVVEVVLEDEVFLDVDLHEGVAADNNWRSDGAEDSGPVICAAAEESAVVVVTWNTSSSISARSIFAGLLQERPRPRARPRRLC
jgi:hypothetical protein